VWVHEGVAGIGVFLYIVRNFFFGQHLLQSFCGTGKLLVFGGFNIFEGLVSAIGEGLVGLVGSATVGGESIEGK
jgi:hypothetical protein